jgi:hypothetical protein
MATVLEMCITEEQPSIVPFWAKGLNAKYIHKEIFPVYGWKYLSRRVTTGSARNHLGGKRFSDQEEVEKEVRKWLRQQSKDFYPAGFDALAKRWDKCINVVGGYVEK